MAQKQTRREGEATPRQGQMTVEEAGRMGGQKGGQRVKELIEEGKRAEREGAGEDIEAIEDEEDGEA
jgi:hypothetical protein